jgi:hypothetical protein
MGGQIVTDVNLEVLAKRLDCSADMYEIVCSIEDLKKKASRKESGYTLSRYSWNMTDSGTICIYDKKCSHESVADIWRIKDHPEGEEVSRSMQIALADLVTQGPYLIKVLSELYDAYYGEDGGATLLCQVLEDESELVKKVLDLWT